MLIQQMDAGSSSGSGPACMADPAAPTHPHGDALHLPPLPVLAIRLVHRVHGNQVAMRAVNAVGEHLAAIGADGHGGRRADMQTQQPALGVLDFPLVEGVCAWVGGGVCGGGSIVWWWGDMRPQKPALRVLDFSLVEGAYASVGGGGGRRVGGGGMGCRGMRGWRGGGACVRGGAWGVRRPLGAWVGARVLAGWLGAWAGGLLGGCEGRGGLARGCVDGWVHEWVGVGEVE